MPDDPGTHNRETEDPAVASRGLAPDHKQFFLDLIAAQSSEPVSPRRAAEIKRRSGLTPTSIKAETFAEAKELFYQELVGAVDGARRSFIGSLAADPRFAPFAKPCDEILRILTTILFTIVGMIGGFAEVAVTTLPELIKLGTSTIEFLGSAVQATFAVGDSGEKGRAEVKETLARLRTVPSTLWTRFTAWKVRFEKASMEMQPIMVGELTVEVLGVLKSAVGVAKLTGRLAKRAAGKAPAPSPRQKKPTPRVSANPGEWVTVARNRGEALELQRALSGKTIKYDKAGKAYIREYKVHSAVHGRPVHFDAFERGRVRKVMTGDELVRRGVLHEAKGNYGHVIARGFTGARDRLLAEAKRHVDVANEYGLEVKWHVRKEDLAGFQNTVGKAYPQIQLIPY